MVLTRSYRAALLLAVIHVLFAPSAHAVASCQAYDDFIEKTKTGLDSRGRVVVNAAGASFPNRLYQQAIFAYQFVEPNAVLAYQSTGSSGGKCRIKNYTDECSKACEPDDPEPYEVDWAGSDSLLSDSDYIKYNNDLQMFPAVAGKF